MRWSSHPGIPSGLKSNLWNAAVAIGLLGAALPFATAARRSWQLMQQFFGEIFATK
jgi:hypothetical protein